MLWQKKAWLFATCQLACLVAVHGVAFGLLHIFIHNYINPAYKLVDLIYYNAAPFLFVLLASVTYIFFVERPKKASLYKAQAQFENVSGGPQAAIKPEFVHTTLGTLLELMKDKPAKAEPVMVKLTSLIEYMMLEPGGNKVSLEMEIDNLKKYIYFTRHRFGNSISLSVPGNIVNESYEVEHLILLRSLQGTLDAKNGMVPGEHIDIYLFNKNNLLNFVISSSIGANGNAVLMPSASGLQANNVRRKLIVNSYQKNNLN